MDDVTMKTAAVLVAAVAAILTWTSSPAFGALLP